MNEESIERTLRRCEVALDFNRPRDRVLAAAAREMSRQRRNAFMLGFASACLFVALLLFALSSGIDRKIARMTAPPTQDAGSTIDSLEGIATPPQWRLLQPATASQSVAGMQIQNRRCLALDIRTDGLQLSRR